MWNIVARIHGKEEMIGQYQEEAEVCKEQNYHQKEQVGLLILE